MFPRLFAFLAILPIAVLSLQCYNYMKSSQMNPAAIQTTSQTCPPDSFFCVKSFQQSQDMNGFQTWIETRNCANQQVCQRNGCFGQQFDQVCCCNGNFCNSATEKVGMLAMLAPIAVYAVNHFV
ncbi:hypothetical protein PENTCL1PPCAC_1953 [Pristionchus entomophagus]|uniref:UPAR/Ly6 domain-containing protein n=1 Tax=Pristionchus entomophagus TaxID=358040 RepID=A0AAV5SC70_9BILA|nr:hypothetical protein PENTCL1PPCAC_1953 [Pristionchus entomophagus]